MVATRSFFRVLALVAAATGFAALAAQPSYEAVRAATVAVLGPLEARSLESARFREARDAQEARLREELMRLQGQLEAASRPKVNPAGDFPPLPRHARLD